MFFCCCCSCCYWNSALYILVYSTNTLIASALELYNALKWLLWLIKCFNSPTTFNQWEQSDTTSLTERHSRLSFKYFCYFWTNCSYSHYSIFCTSESGNCFYEKHHINFYLVNTNIHYCNKYLSLVLCFFSKNDNELTPHLFQYPRNDSYSKCSLQKIRQEI